MLHEKSLHLRLAAQMRQLGIPMRQKNNPQRNPQQQQSNRL